MSNLLELFTHKKGTILLSVFAVFIIGTILIIRLADNPEQGKNADKVPLKTETSPITKRFPTIKNFKTCYWKANTIGKTNFGPTCYWMKGFIVLSEDSFKETREKYDWKPTNVILPEGIDPKVTGFTTFNWCYNKQFSDITKTEAFIGEFYLDIINGVLYFDVENK
ncbi:MAG: hypothetical protein ACM3KR_05945 [Deltaproteobacteria bacterium]